MDEHKDVQADLSQEIEKSRRPAALIATIGLIGVAGGSVGGLVYDLAVNGGSQSIPLLGTLATAAVAGLLALAGARNGN